MRRRLALAVIAALALTGCPGDVAEDLPPASTEAPRPLPTLTVGGGRLGIVEPPLSGVPPVVRDVYLRALEDVLANAPAEVTSVRTLTPDDTVFKLDLLELLAQDRRDLVCAVGPDVADDVVAAARRFPAVNFCGVGQLAAQPPENAHTIAYRMYDGAYIAGVVSGLRFDPALADTNVGVLVARGADERARAAFREGVARVGGSIPIEAVVVQPAEGESVADAAARIAAELIADGAVTLHVTEGVPLAPVLETARTLGAGVVAGGPEVQASLASPALVLAYDRVLEVGLARIVDLLIGDWRSGATSLGLREGAIRVQAGGFPGAAEVLDRARGAIEDVREGRVDPGAPSG